MILTLGLVVFGVIMVFSASYYQSINESKNGTPYNYLIKDVIWAVLGFGLMIFTAVFDYRHYKKIALPALAVSFILLVLLLIPGVGQTTNGATRWLGVGSFYHHARRDCQDCADHLCGVVSQRKTAED